MDIFLLTISFIIMIVGIIGSVIPVLPGPLSSWLGLFIFSNISKVEVSNNLLFITLIVALIIFILDYILPIYTSKKFGASKYGIIGASVGTVIGLFFPPLGIIFGSIIGAISGEMLLNKNKANAVPIIPRMLIATKLFKAFSLDSNTLQVCSVINIVRDGGSKSRNAIAAISIDL